MALLKEIKQSDGVVTKYHRILFITSTINKQNSIAVLSYVDDEAREGEKENIFSQPYVKSVTYETDYTEDMTISSAYDFLKTLEIFEGATDI